jgi:hypothetical protein
MDEQHLLFARPRRPALRRFALTSASAGLALALSGCDADRVNTLEERVTAVEAKADAAEKRAKAAESLAASQTQTVSQPDPAPQSDINPGDDDAVDTSVDGADEAPPPMADNGKG